MDPTWDIEHMSHSSKTFPLVLKMLQESRVLTSQSLRTANDIVLKTVIDVLSDNCASAQFSRLSGADLVA